MKTKITNSIEGVLNILITYLLSIIILLCLSIERPTIGNIIIRSKGLKVVTDVTVRLCLLHETHHNLDDHNILIVPINFAMPKNSVNTENKFKFSKM